MNIGELDGVKIVLSPEAYAEVKKRKIIEENKILKELQQELDKYKNIVDELEKLVRNQLYGAFVPTGRTDGKVLQEIERKIEELKGE